MPQRDEHSAENDAARHWPECWCNGTGWRKELGVPCRLPQLSTSEREYLNASVTPPGKCDADCEIPDCDGSAHQPSWKRE